MVNSRKKYQIANILHPRCLRLMLVQSKVTLYFHYSDVIMNAIALQIIGVSIVCSSVFFRRRSKKHQSSALLAFVSGIHQWPMDSPHRGPVTRKMFPFDDIIMIISDAPPGNIALKRASWQSSEYKETPALRGVDGNIYTRSCIKPKQGNAYFAVDFNSTVGLWNVRLVIQQQGGWQQRFTPCF